MAAAAATSTTASDPAPGLAPAENYSCRNCGAEAIAKRGDAYATSVDVDREPCGPWVSDPLVVVDEYQAA
jgi:hypothetical protein